MEVDVDIGTIPISEWKDLVRHFCSDIRIRDVNVGCRILPTSRPMSMPTYAHILSGLQRWGASEQVLTLIATCLLHHPPSDGSQPAWAIPAMAAATVESEDCCPGLLTRGCQACVPSLSRSLPGATRLWDPQSEGCDCGSNNSGAWQSICHIILCCDVLDVCHIHTLRCRPAVAAAWPTKALIRCAGQLWSSCDQSAHETAASQAGAWNGGCRRRLPTVIY